jgi:transposase-like protein
MAGSKVSQQRRPYRRWPAAEKRRIVELTLREGVSARAIAREYGISHNSLCRWKARYRAGTLETPLPRAARVRADGSPPAFLPVTVTPATRRPHIAVDTAISGCSMVQLSLASGATLRIETSGLDVAMLCALIEQLQR